MIHRLSLVEHRKKSCASERPVFGTRLNDGTVCGLTRVVVGC